MFLVKSFIAAAAVIVSLNASAAIRQGEKETAVNFSQVFVQKINLEDETVLVLTSGFFPNGCYTWDHSVVTHPDTFTHEVRGFAGVKQAICTMMIMPFTQEIRIGKLEVGHHTIRIYNGDGTSFVKEIEVE